MTGRRWFAVAVAAAITLGGAPPAMADEAPVRPSTAVLNGDFEAAAGRPDAIPGWRISGTPAAAKVIAPGNDSEHALQLGSTGRHDVTVGQTVKGLADGYYTVSLMARSSGQDAVYLFAEGSNGGEARTALPVRADWTVVVVRGVRVDKGTLHLGVRAKSAAGGMSTIDSVTLTRAGGPYEFLQGGDISQLNLVEDAGATFADETGKRQDPLRIMAEKGVNIVRLRLYNNTGPDHPRIGFPNSYLPDGYGDLADNLDLARRAARYGMKIQLTLHYSDYWSNGAIQDIPKDWRSVENLPDAQAVDELTSLVGNYTRDVVKKFSAQGTPVDYVSLGNEMQGGLLFPYGRAWGGTETNLFRFLKAGYAGAKAADPRTQVVIHLDDAGNYDKYRWFFGMLRDNGVPWDVIGSSYYPYWTQKDVPTVLPFFDTISREFGKKILVTETGFNWNPLTSYGEPGQLENGGPVPYPDTPQGQRDFLYELFAGLKSVPDGNVIGDLYWDPVMIPAEGVGWEVGQPNVVENTTLFDFTGRALPGLDAYLYNVSAGQRKTRP
ncbi:arabinogalactan endo-1,4-beta-galactosidase [Kribbella amoyensis]|uniref:Arabinogalactan endo-beta-1,4-galactanase n=1 Tax=Kribbella amoyensis TaxID=996641 RepID=A0A561BUI7_9ACTN|nr:glycosyl hydrolase 53 family protein [Kribbella amoyensis]TWD82580.1 arabinogalactan endo-1,4-beta-galactosidase [Kribbella amoyensis]